MNIKTVFQQDFPPHKLEKTPSAKYEKKDNYDIFKLSGLSNYKKDFPHWGHYEFIGIKDTRKGFMNPNLQIDQVTTYSQNFCQHKKTPAASSQKKIEILNPLATGKEFFGQTTSRETFKTFDTSSFPERVKNKAFGILPLESPSKTYKTMYSTDYVLGISSPLYQKKKDFIPKE
jgi:hypothetical protein